jgi:hypothetical protein
MRITNDKRSVQAAIFPAILVAITKDALEYSKNNAESEELKNINEKAAKMMFDTISRPEVLKRLERLINRTMRAFVDARDGKYHIRKVVLALHGMTQEAFNIKMINEQIGELIQEALNLEGTIPMEEEDWVKLKSSADKKSKEVFNIIKSI